MADCEVLSSALSLKFSVVSTDSIYLDSDIKDPSIRKKRKAKHRLVHSSCVSDNLLT